MKLPKCAICRLHPDAKPLSAVGRAKVYNHLLINDDTIQSAIERFFYFNCKTDSCLIAYKQKSTMLDFCKSNCTKLLSAEGVHLLLPDIIAIVK